MKDLIAGNLKAAMKGAGASSGDLWKVPPAQLRTLDGYNVRQHTQAYTDRVRWLADRIKASGYDTACPLAAFVDKDGTIYLTDGHRRLAAVLLAISEGVAIEYVPVIVRPRGTDMVDLTVALVTSNEGQPLTTFENALVCKRLIGYGLTSSDIAQRLGYSSTQYVDGLLSLAGAPVALQKMVIEGVVSATVAIATLTKHGHDAVDVLVESLQGKAKVTAKDLPAQQLKARVKKAAPAMLSTLKELEALPEYVYIPEALRARIAILLGELVE